MTVQAPRRDASAERAVTVVIAEDDAAMRMALCALIGDEPTLDLVGAGGDADDAVRLAAEHRPQVCVVDVTMPGGGGARAARGVLRCSPGTTVLALSGRDDRAAVVEMLRAGASGYLVKGNDGRELVDAIHTAARGERALSRQVADSVICELSDHLVRQDEVDRAARAKRARIDHVLARGLFTMVFQPIVDLDQGRVVLFEALARFTTEPARHPETWLAEAAETGRLVDLELALAGAALAQLHLLPADVGMTVNVSPATALSGELPGLLPPEAPGRVVVEITEHAPVEDYDALALQLEALRARGVKVAIDDAGAGFASLRHILRLSPHVIKTDMALTRNVERQGPERALARALVSFANEIDAVVVAEGIETQAELDALIGLGVRFGQGFRLGRPAPIRQCLRELGALSSRAQVARR